MKKCIVLLLVLVSAICVSAKVETVYPIEVKVINEYNVKLGDKFVYEIKENIRKSSNLKLENEGSRIIMKIMIAPRFIETPESSIIYSVIWLFENNKDLNYYLNNTMGFSGNNVYKNGAESLIIYTDEVITMFEEWYKK